MPYIFLAFSIIYIGTLSQGIGANKGGSQPLRIESQHGIECDQTTQQCYANRGVTAYSGDIALTSNKARLFFRKTNGKLEAWRVIAEGKVHFIGPKGENGLAHKATYDIDSNCLNLEALPGAEQQTAFWRGSDLLLSDTLKIIFKDSKLKAQDISSRVQEIRASGNVIVSTPTEIAFSKQGLYYPGLALVQLEQNVRIYRAQGKLVGQRMQFNLKTGHSMLLPAKVSPNTGRVPQIEVTIYPKTLPHINKTTPKFYRPKNAS